MAGRGLAAIDRKLPRGQIYVLEDRCKGCSFCVDLCPNDVLEQVDLFTDRGYHPPRVQDRRSCLNCDMCTLVCPEFAIYSLPSSPSEAAPGHTELGGLHPMDDILRTRLIPHILCPGCGIGVLVKCFADALRRVDHPLDKQAVVTGIGCTGRVAGYINVDSYHTIHGRAIAFATGLKLAKPEMAVTVIGGDGDLFAIGGNHFLHAARRNIDLKVICVNNFNYGMTGGQVAPTTPLNSRTTTSPLGNQDPPLNLPKLAIACGARYVARWTTYHVRQLRQAIEETFTRKGFTFIEVISPCPTCFGRQNEFKEGIEEMLYYKEETTIARPPRLEDADINLGDPFVVGTFYDAGPDPSLSAPPVESIEGDGHAESREVVAAPVAAQEAVQ